MFSSQNMFYALFVTGMALVLILAGGCGKPKPSREASAVKEVVQVETSILLSQELKVLLTEADDLKRKGRFAEAIAVYEKVLQQSPDSPEPYFYLGALYFGLNLKTKAETFYQKAIDLNYGDPEVYFHLGYIKEDKAAYREALEYYLKAEEKGVASAKLFFNIGNVYVQLGSKEKAVDSYKKAVELEPSNLDLFINLSVTSFHLSRYDDADRYLKRAVELGYVPPPEYVEALKEGLGEQVLP